MFERAFECRTLDKIVLALRMRPELGAAMLLYILPAFCSHLFKHFGASGVFDPLVSSFFFTLTVQDTLEYVFYYKV